MRNWTWIISSALVICGGVPGFAGVIELNPVTDVGGSDVGQSGIYTLNATNNGQELVGYTTGGSGTEHRIAFEFDLSAIPVGAVILSAKLTLFITATQGGPTLEIHGAAGDGVVSSSDMLINSQIGSDFNESSLINFGTQTFYQHDLTSFTQSRVSNNDSHALLLLRADLSSPLPSMSQTATIEMDDTAVLADIPPRPSLFVQYESASSAVPEPATFFLAALGLLMLALAGRRRLAVRSSG